MSAISLSKAEKSFIHAGILASPPQRKDGRALEEFRNVALETGVAPLANGSARVNIGRHPREGGGGTEVLAATKLEVEDVESDESVDGGRIVCAVTCSPAAYPHLSTAALEDLQQDFTTLVHQTLSHPSLHPANLSIIPKKKSWLLILDLVVLSDSGNVYDALFMAARAALWDTKVPRTRVVELNLSSAIKTTTPSASEGMDVDTDANPESGLDTRRRPPAQDFDLPDYWDEGEDLQGKQRWPVCLTFNVVPKAHFFDATLEEEAAVPVRLLVMYSFEANIPAVQAIRVIGPAELQLEYIQKLVQDGQKPAKLLFDALGRKFSDEDLRRNTKEKERFAAAR
ncbi:hypothetical protein AX16_007420 [Volvariella volvacea WC 439]|nr:hypothetical protein AX16_007420 [Volvariella volvacea WC 439]